MKLFQLGPCQHCSRLLEQRVLLETWLYIAGDCKTARDGVQQAGWCIIPKRLSMLKGSLLNLSTPAEVTRTKRLTPLGVARMRLPVAMESVCSGPLPPFHLCNTAMSCSETPHTHSLSSSQLKQFTAEATSACTQGGRHAVGRCPKTSTWLKERLMSQARISQHQHHRRPSAAVMLPDSHLAPAVQPLVTG